LDYEKERKILTDVDGVLLDWESAFDEWMQSRGYTVKDPTDYKQYIRYGITKEESDSNVERFNTSAWIGYLKPLRDAIDIVHRFGSHHWHFECITSLSTDQFAGLLRTSNLESVFGRGPIRRVRCIDTGADKDDILKEYEPGHWWIEDKPENCEAGLRAGHKPIIIDHRYNQDYNGALRAKTWKDVFKIITKNT